MIGGAVAAAAGVVLAGWLAATGLDEADKWASVLGLFVALAGLVVAVGGLLSGGRPARPDVRAQTVADSSVGGSVAQVRAGGTVTIRRGPAAGPVSPAVPADARTAVAPAGQTVRGLSTTGDLDQVAAARDVVIEDPS